MSLLAVVFASVIAVASCVAIGVINLGNMDNLLVSVKSDLFEYIPLKVDIAHSQKKLRGFYRVF